MGYVLIGCIWLRLSYEVAVKLSTAPVLAISENMPRAGGNSSMPVHTGLGKKAQCLATWAAHDPFPK